MTRDAISRALRGLTALVVLAAIAGAPPVVLTLSAGWPLPTTVPSADEIWGTLRGSRVDPLTVMKAFAVVGWLAWLQVIASIAAELSGHLARRTSRRVPGGSLVQPLVRRLVLASTLLTSGIKLAEPTVALAAAPAAVTLTPEPAPQVAAESTPAPDRAPTVKTVTVKPRDTLWALAEQHLDDPFRWRHIWALNEGKQFPDGRTLRDPDLIRPGWTLTMPDDATGLDQPAAPISNPAPPPAVVEQPDTNEATSNAQDQVAESTRAGSQDDAVAETAAGEGVEEESPEEESERPPSPAVLAAGSLLAAGLVAGIGRRRVVQLRRRRQGFAPHAPRGEEARTEARLRRAAADADPDRLDTALRCLASQITDARPVPVIQAVTVGSDAVEVLFQSGVQTDSGPYAVSADGRAWTLPADVPTADLVAAAEKQGSPAPALATVARIDDRELLLDLEANPRVAVVGPDEAAVQLLWSIGYSLATASWSDDVDVIAVGEPPGSLLGFDRVRQCSSIAEAVEEGSQVASAMRRAFDEQGYTSSLGARLAFPGDPMTPTVLLIGIGDDGVDAAFAAARDAVGFAVVAACAEAPDADATLVLEGDDIVVQPLGIRGEAIALASGLASDLDELLAAPADETPGESTLTVIDLTTSQGEGRVDGDALWVNVLGPVEVVGGEAPIDRRRSHELFVYLAMHPQGADESRLRLALWPDSAPSLHLLNQTISRARSCLGAASDGALHLPYQEAGLYRPGAHVLSDAAALEDAYGKAHGDPCETTMADLRARCRRSAACRSKPRRTGGSGSTRKPSHRHSPPSSPTQPTASPPTPLRTMIPAAPSGQSGKACLPRPPTRSSIGTACSRTTRKATPPASRPPCKSSLPWSTASNRTTASTRRPPSSTKS